MPISKATYAKLFPCTDPNVRVSRIAHFASVVNIFRKIIYSHASGGNGAAAINRM
jgi:hypothetical protein